MKGEVGGAHALAAAAIALVAFVLFAGGALASPEPTALVPLADTTAPANFTMNSEPSYTNNTSNTVSWSAGDDPGNSTPIEYYAEVSRQLGFGTIEANSGWIQTTSTTFSGLQDGVLYYYRVRARDSSGNVAGFTAPTSSTQDTSPPSAPIIGVEPSFTVGTSNTVSWGASTDAGTGGVEYFAEASSSSIFSSIFGNSGWISGTSTTFSSLTSATTYYYHVKARDGFGHVSAWSSVEFSTQDADAPTVPAIDTEPSFTAGTWNVISWSPSTDSGVGGVQYQLQFSASSTFASGVVSSPWQSSTSFNATPLAGGTTYYYRVSSRDAFAQQSSFSPIVSSTQDSTPPSTPGATAEPTYTNGTTNTILWTASTDAQSGGVEYYVEQSRSSTFATLEDVSGWVSSTSTLFTKLDDGVTYYHRVKARNAVGLESGWSSTVSSTQDASAPSNPVIAPEPAYSAGTSNSVFWGASSDAGVAGVQYLAERSSSSTFSTIDATVGWTAATSASFASLTDGNTYYYRVKARDSFGHESSYSAVTSSRQDNSPPTTPVLDLEPLYTRGLSNTITWAASLDAGSGGVQYFLQYSTSSTFAFGVVTVGPQSAVTATVGSLAGGTTYYYRVTASDALGFFSLFSAIVSSTQDNAPPPVPALTAEPSFTQGTTNQVSWGAVVDAGAGGVEYWVESSRTGAFTVIDSSSGWIPAASFTFTRLDDGVRYSYRVKARDALLQESAFSASVNSQQDAAAPPVPAMNTLAAISPGTLIVVTWGSVTDTGIGSVQYFAEASTTPTFATTLGNSGWTGSTFWVVSGLSDGVTYFYHVKSRDGLLQESVYSPSVFSRQDNAAPTAPSMVAEPAFTAGTSNTVSWTTSTDSGIGGVVYDVQIATNAAFTGATTVFSLAVTSNTFSGLSGGSIYFYRVRARDAFSISTAFSSSTSSRQDNSAPPQPGMSAEPGFTAGTSNVVSWNVSVDAGVGGVTYLVQAARSPTFSTIEAESGWISATSFTFTRMEDGATYYYRVAARDSLLFQTPFSSAVSSTQDNSAPSVPVLVSEPAFTAGTSNTVSWGASVDAGVGSVQYQYRYSTDPSFASGVTTSAFQTGTSATASGLTNALTYYYQVHSRDSFGFTSAWSNAVFSTQDASGPSVPAMGSEPSFTAGTSNTISWSPSTDAGIGGLQYWAEYAATPSFSTVLSSTGWQTGTSATFVGLTDGVRFYFRAKARDAFLQESAFSSVVNSQQDNSPPSTPTTSALATYTAGESVTFMWFASSDAGVGGIEYEAQYLSGSGGTVLGSSGWISATSFTFSPLSDGSTYLFRVRARDAFQNTGSFSLSRSTTMDASPPTVPLMIPEPAFTAGTSNVVSWSASTDAGVGGVRYQLQYSSQPGFTGSSTVTTAVGVSSPYTVGGLLDGVTYFFRVRALDGFSYVSSWSAPERSRQDASPPTVPAPVPLPLVIDGSATHFYWLESTDAGVGGIEYQARVSDDPFFFTVTATGPWGPRTEYLFTGLRDATVYYYQARARDAFGYTSSWSFPQFALTDFLPPPVPVATSLPSWSKGLSTTVAWRAVLDAGVGGVEYQVVAFLSTDTTAPFAQSPWVAGTSGLIGGLPENTLVYFGVRARDALGHTSNLSQLISTRMDNSAPPVPGLSGLPPFTSGQNLGASWSVVVDGGVGGVLYRAQVSLDPTFQTGVIDSGWVTGNSTTAGGLVDGGLYFVRVKAQDAFNFETAWSALERTRMDASPPSVPVLDALDTFTSGSSVVVTWSAAQDAGVGGVQYFVELSRNVTLVPVINQSGWVSGTSWPFSGLVDGTRYYFTVRARDTFLRASTPSNVAFTTMDASPPTPPELLVLSAYSAGLQQTVRWGPSVDLGIGGVEYGVESSTNASFGSGTVGSGWITASQYTFAGLADGSQYFFRARARDAFGYLSPWSAVRNTTVDDSAPTIAPDQSSVLTSDPDLLLTGTVSDSVSVVAQVMFSTDGGVSWSGTSVVNGSWQASVTGLSEGRTTVLVQAFDTVGHESAIARIEVTVDATAPLVAFTSPTNNTTVTGLVGIYAVIADANFDSFRLQERKVGVANFTDIVANGSAARGDNFLGLWDTRTLANGMYELRLTARDALGQATTRAIQIRVLNSDIAVSYGDLQFSDRMPTAGDTINVTGVVTNFGTAPAENVTVRIKDNGVVVFDRSGLTIGAHASFTAQVAYRINGSGPHAFTIEVSYPEGARDEGTTASATITVLAPPVPEPTPFLIEFADALGPLLILAIVALAVLVGWMFVELRRLRTMPRSGGAVAVSGDNVQMEWDADSTFY